MRVLLIAEGANPEWVSGPLVAWSLYRALSHRVDTHLITHVRNRDALLRAGLSAAEFSTVDSEWIARPLWRLSSVLRGGEGRGWTTASAFGAIAYYEFERVLWRSFSARLHRGEFDLVHRIYPISPTCPSIVASKLARIGIPFVLGPLNGGLPWPRGFRGTQWREREWLSHLRGAYRVLPGHRGTREHASAILVASLATLEQLGRKWWSKCVYFPENGIDPEDFAPIIRPPARPPLRVTFVGRLVPYKGVDLLLKAAAPLIRERKIRLEIVGDGPEMPGLRALASSLETSGGVLFHGWVPHGDISRFLSGVDVFGFPSIREFGGGAVLEAMARGVAPLVVDYGGPGELVTSETGRKVPLGSRDEIITALARELASFAAHPELTRALGQSARERALSLFTWQTKADQVLEVYRWALGQRQPKPSFGLLANDPLSTGLAATIPPMSGRVPG